MEKYKLFKVELSLYLVQTSFILYQFDYVDRILT